MMERKCNNIINVFNQTRWQIKYILDGLVVFRSFDTWIHYQVSGEGELLSLNDPTFCLQEIYSSTAGSFSVRRAATGHVDIYFT